MPRSAPGDDAQSRARRVFGPRVTSLTVAGARIFSPIDGSDRRPLGSPSQVHGANQVARRHVRAWLCDNCRCASGVVRSRPPESPSRARSFSSRPARALGVNKTYRPERRREHLPDASPSTPERLPPTPAIVPVLNHPSDVSSAPQVACTVNRAVLCAGCDELTRHTAGGQPRVPLLSFSLADDAAVDANYHLSRHPFREDCISARRAPPETTPRRPIRAARRRLARRPRVPRSRRRNSGTVPPPPPAASFLAVDSPSASPSGRPGGATPPRGSVRAVGEPRLVERSVPSPVRGGEVGRRWSAARWRASEARIQLVQRERPHRAVHELRRFVGCRGKRRVGVGRRPRGAG